MSSLTVLYAALFYLATSLLVAGVTRKIVDYARTPAPLKIPTTPAPLTTAGVVLRHLRYFQQPVWPPVVWLQPFGIYAGLAMVGALGGLWARRFLVDRVRYISTPSDHLMLALLLAIGLTGLAMSFVAHTDIIAVKAFMLGLMRFDLQPLPADPALLLHLALVAVLMIVFPISKLLHAPGLFFSPTRNQADTSREARHIAAWAAALDKK